MSEKCSNGTKKFAINFVQIEQKISARKIGSMCGLLCMPYLGIKGPNLVFHDILWSFMAFLWSFMSKY